MKTFLLFLTFSWMVFNPAFATDNKNRNKIDYNNFVKFRETNYSYQKYSDYLKTTPFDDEFRLSLVDQTPGYGTTPSGNILVILNQKLYNPVTLDDIETYKNDLESEGYSVSIVLSTNSNDPAALRNFLYQEWTTNNIDGAFLIGQLPVAWYEMAITNDDGDTTGWDQFPCDLYFMDLDGEWLDNMNRQGVWDDHTGALEPDIWIGRLYTSTMTYHGVNETMLVERYLTKVHQYREGTLRLKNQGFSYVAEDWAGFHMENEVFKLYDEVTFVNDGINGNVTAADYRQRIRATTNNKYEWMYLAAHSSPTDHYFKDGLFNSEEIEPLDVQILFYLNFNCSAARFTEDNCLCNWYVMQDPYGLLSVGSTKSGSMLDQYDYYEQIAAGHTFGEAFKYWGVRHFEIRDWHYGMVCIGDPTLKISRFMANPGPRFCYAITPERDAFINSATPIFKWTTADSVDKYMVEVSHGDQIIWISNQIPDTLIQIPEGFLQRGFSYNWTVKAYSGTECIDFTQKRTFTIIDTTEGIISEFINPDFEQGSYGWTFGDLNPEAQMIDTTQAHSGKASLRHFLDKRYYAYTNQEIDVPNSIYTLHAWVKTSGDQYSSVIELRKIGENINIQLPQQPTLDWTKVSKIFKVTTGKIFVGIYSNAPANSWINVDDMSIVRGADLSVPVTLIAPRNESILTATDNVLLDWEDILGSSGYRVFLFCDDQCILDKDNLSQSQFQIPDSLLSYGKTYQWYVRWKKGELYSESSTLWTFSIATSEKTDYYLSDLMPEYYRQDWGTLQFDKSCDGNTITIAGQEFEKGLGTHANSIIRYDLNGHFKWFTAWIGHDDESNGGNGVTFEVKLDGSTIYKPGKVFQWGMPAEYIKLNVSNGDKLELLVHSGGDIDYDHADWADAKVWVDSVYGDVKNIASQTTPPQNMVLLGNYPNPFNSHTTILFIAPPESPISLIIYNVLGEKVKTLIDQKKLSGAQKAIWDGTDNLGNVLSSGIYFCKISNGKQCKTSKILLLR